MIKQASASSRQTTQPALRSPARLGFAGVGWIGRNRLEALAATGRAKIVAVADPDPQAASHVADHYGATQLSFTEMLDLPLDGIVIATPSAMHATQAIAALSRGIPVFCQKPLARNGRETAAVVAAAEHANRLLGVDFSYRHTAGMAAIRHLIHSGQLGEIFAIEATFHNAYGPDKPWFYQRSLAGGGCLLDLGIHLVDLALWALDFPAVSHARAILSQQGRPLTNHGEDVEDYATAVLATDSGTSIQLACSWRAPAGCDAQIAIRFFGTRGGASLTNIDGSFFDFHAEHLLTDRSRRTLTCGQDAWPPRAALAWLDQLHQSPQFRQEIHQATRVANTLDLLTGCQR